MPCSQLASGIKQVAADILTATKQVVGNCSQLQAFCESRFVTKVPFCVTTAAGVPYKNASSVRWHCLVNGNPGNGPGGPAVPDCRTRCANAAEGAFWDDYKFTCNVHEQLTNLSILVEQKPALLKNPAQGWTYKSGFQTKARRATGHRDNASRAVYTILGADTCKPTDKVLLTVRSVHDPFVQAAHLTGFTFDFGVDVRPSPIPSLCTCSTRAGIEWCCCHRAVCMARPR